MPKFPEVRRVTVTGHVDLHPDLTDDEAKQQVREVLKLLAAPHTFTLTTEVVVAKP